MGASASKSQNHLDSFYEKASKRTSLISPSSKIEPSSDVYSSRVEKKQSKKRKYKFHTRKSKKDNVTKSIIGRPTNFVHLNHAGIDYTSMDTLFMPIEEAQKIEVKAPIMTTNKTLSPATGAKVLSSSERRINLSMQANTESKHTMPGKTSRGAGSQRKPIDYNALFSNELYSLTHDINFPPSSTSPLTAVC